jgi:hypothetical protein
MLNCGIRNNQIWDNSSRWNFRYTDVVPREARETATLLPDDLTWVDEISESVQYPPSGEMILRQLRKRGQKRRPG